MEKNGFTNNEVVTMFESLKSEIGIIAEGVSDLGGRMSSVENRLSSVETEVKSLKDVMRVAIPTLSQRVTRLETKVGI